MNDCMPPTIPQANPAAPGANDMRVADRHVLSLTLMDARNQTLQLLARFEAAINEGLTVPMRDECELPLWLAGHIAWPARKA